MGSGSTRIYPSASFSNIPFERDMCSKGLPLAANVSLVSLMKVLGDFYTAVEGYSIVTGVTGGLAD